MKAFGILTAIGLFVTFATASWMEGTPAHAAGDADKGALTSAEHPHPADGNHPVLGRQRRFALRFETRIEHPGDKAPLTVNVTGDWVTTLTSAREGEQDVACQIVGARLSGTGVAQASHKEIEALAQRLSRRFWVTYRNDGAALRVHFPKDMAKSDRNLLEMIVTETEVVRPAADEPQWTAIERDGAGTYLAVYQRLPHRPVQLVKRKLQYLHMDGAGTPAHTLAIKPLASEWRIFLDDAGEVTGIEGSEHLRISMPMAPATATKDMSHLDIGSDVHLSNPRTDTAPELIGSLERALSTVDTAPLGTQAWDSEETVAARDRRLLEGTSTKALIESAKAGNADPLLPARLAALFRQRPEAINLGATLVRENHGYDIQALTNALAAAGTPPAIEALGGLARDRAITRQSRIDALNALIGLRTPIPSAVRIATDLLDDSDPEVRRAARMVAGAVAHALRTTDPEAQQSIERALIARYPGATAPEQADLLEGLGNSGSSMILATAEAALRSGHTEVRAAAAHALRRIDDPAVDRLLAAVITGDQNERVRAKAVSAAEVRWPEQSSAPPRPAGDPLVASIIHAAIFDAAESVRARAIGVLRRRQEPSQDIQAALTKVAEQDPSPGVRRLAREALAARTGAPR